jgi:protocatechuate 3,4-dioxygenase beta subunit
MRRAMVLLFLCHGLGAQSQQAVDPASLARVEGRVVNSVTGEPLRKADLMLHGSAGSGYSAASDASGHFIIEKVAPGDYNLTAEHQNYAVLEYGSTRPGIPGTRLSLTAGQGMTGLELKLVPFGVISGKVVDQDGDPVANVPVTVMHWGFMRGARQLAPSGGGAATNDRGEFRIYSLASGRYFVVARPIRSDMYGMTESTGRRTGAVRAEASREYFTTTLYPSTPDVASASPVTVNAGQEVPGIDIQLRKTRTYSVQGKVAGLQKGRRYSLSLQQQDAASSGSFGMSRASAIRPEDGSFAFRGVPPGRYTLIAMADNRVGARQEVSIGDGDLDGLTVVVLDPGVVKGRVQMEAGVTKPSLKGLRVSLTPVDAIPMNLPNASTGDDGTFGMEEVAVDRYKVSCSPVEGAYLKTIRWSGQISNDGTVDMTSGSTATLDLVFAATSAIIDGDVKTSDDKPAPGVPVLLAPASGREPDFRLVMADQNGHFAAKSVAPGSYTALATDAAIYSMPDAALLKALAKVTTAVNVDENGHSTVSLKLVTEAAIEATQ